MLGEWGRGKTGDEGGKRIDKRVSRERGRREEDLACFSFGSVSGLLGLRRFHRGALVSAASS